MIKDFKTYESVNEINDKYLIGLPSGQIIDIDYKQINNLKQDGLIVYNKQWKSYVFKDEFYYNILNKLNRTEFSKELMSKITKFFDYQRNVRNYMLTKDGVDVSGSVYVSGLNIVRFPFTFNKVTGDFIFKNCRLESLNGGPTEVGEDFIVSNNVLFNLIGGPKYVGKVYDCSSNCINSLEGSPKKIFGDFNCSDNFLQDLVGGPKIVNGFYDCTNNRITSMKGGPDFSGKMIIKFEKREKVKNFDRFKLKDDGEGKYRW